MGMCLAQCGVGGKWMRGLGLGFTNPMGTWGVCLWFGCGGVCVGSVGGEWVVDLD